MGRWPTLLAHIVLQALNLSFCSPPLPIQLHDVISVPASFGSFHLSVVPVLYSACWLCTHTYPPLWLSSLSLSYLLSLLSLSYNATMSYMQMMNHLMSFWGSCMCCVCLFPLMCCAMGWRMFKWMVSGPIRVRGEGANQIDRLSASMVCRVYVWH